ncbi:hypothetical protein [Ruegeria arenilitoris]|uniref:hypothetical protein n=1 Tax=Ruegeria arenilitoris TaxID=1173585 RepID=UPI001480B560|nr:hypothetical protein [Ruegeria arenilitoris]
MEERRQKLVDGLVAGMSRKELQELIGVSNASITRWLQEDEVKEAYRAALVTRMGLVLPGFITAMEQKSQDPKTGLMALAKAFETLANKSGFEDANKMQQQPAALGIEINLNTGDEGMIDVTPDEEKVKLIERIKTLEAQLSSQPIPKEDDAA